MWQTGYPLHVMHGYVIPASEALEFSTWCAGSIRRPCPRSKSSSPAPLLSMRRWCWKTSAPGAAATDRGVGAGRARRPVVSLLPEAEEARALIAAAQELNVLRSRSPEHGEELAVWTDQFMATSGIDETVEGSACAGPRALADTAGARIRTIAGAIPQHHLARRFCRGRPSRPRLHRARGVLPPCRPARRRTVSARAGSRPRA